MPFILDESPMLDAGKALAEIAERLSPATLLRRDEPLARRTTLRVGGTADFYAEPASEHDLAQLLQCRRQNDLPLLVLGRGSNLLIRDGGIRGLVISLSHDTFSRIVPLGTALWCGAGVKLKLAAQTAKKHSLGGMEFLEGIPGTVGGALRMNAGAMGADIFSIVGHIRFMTSDGETLEKPSSFFEADYRNCAFFKTNIALGALLNGQPAAIEDIETKLEESRQKRRASQPIAPSAGCIFKNAAEIPAGKLIDQLGLKGRRVGGAIVSDVHGNFIVNDGSATAADVLELISIVKNAAFEQRGIRLDTEVEIVGDDA